MSVKIKEEEWDYPWNKYSVTLNCNENEKFRGESG